MVALVVSTKGRSCLEVFEASVRAYAPSAVLHIFNSVAPSFGEAFNHAMASVFKGEDEMVICNDDIVLTPTSLSLLLDDVSILRARYGNRLGFVAARSDHARGSQLGKADTVDRLPAVSPFFAWVSKDAFQAAQFPPLDWYSDDVMCMDLNDQGFSHFASRSYVHHVGSVTIGPNHAAQVLAARRWMAQHRPAYARILLP